MFETLGTITARLNKELNITIRESRIRRYVEWELIPFTKGKNRYYMFDEKGYQQAKLVCMFVECGVSINVTKAYLNGNKEVVPLVWERVKGTELCVNLLKKALREN